MRYTLRKVQVLALFGGALLFACGGNEVTKPPPEAGPPEGTSSGSGTFGGEPFNPAGAVFNAPIATTDLAVFKSLFPTASPAVTGTVAALVVGNSPSTCANFQSGNGTALQAFIVLFDVDANGTATPPTTPGEYKIVNSVGQSWAGRSALVLVGVCGTKVGRYANAGTVTLTSVSSSQMVGKFDIQVTLGEVYGQATGTFSAQACPAVSSTSGSC